MKINTKLAHVNDTFTIRMCDNGYVFEIGGRTVNDDWDTVTIVCNTVEEVYALTDEATKMERT
jgi:hypothetical protein